MVALSDIRDWLKSFNLFSNYYIGRLDTKKKNSLGIYNLQDTGRRENTVVLRMAYLILCLLYLVGYHQQRCYRSAAPSP